MRHLPFSEAHGAHMDAARPYDTRNLCVHKSSVPPLRLRASHSAVPGTMVVEELLGEVPASHHAGNATNLITINKEGGVPG